MSLITAHIDTNALQHNLKQVREFAPNSRVMAMIKANGYGHGLVPVAQALADADALGVARIDEGLELRAAGIDNTIVLMEGVFSADELQTAARENFQIVIHQPQQLELLQTISLDKPIPVWLKLDTGMHRLGFALEDTQTVYQQLQQCDSVADDIRLMSHFANAEITGDNYTSEQCRRFQTAIEGLTGEVSLANSAAILRWSDTHADWVRPGLMLFGVSPLAEQSGAELNLQPAMTLKANIIAVKSLRAGAPVGYDGIWRAPTAMNIAIVAAGYGDGYPWRIAQNTPVLLNGKHATIVGRVSMDMLAIDLRGHESVTVGDAVTLWGEGLPVEDIARYANTIPYCLLTAVTRRVGFDYKN
ncbi:MAG: alanine racemase [Legionellales bacterium]|nr:alanine racemase [Legionellales bacterium]|tara:strand:- start:41041 stop:42117 length:1077 start_codon:yes stop_codon:yes gene_type:complete